MKRFIYTGDWLSTQEIHQYKDMSPFASKAEKSTDKEARETDYSED